MLCGGRASTTQVFRGAFIPIHHHPHTPCTHPSTQAINPHSHPTSLRHGGFAALAVDAPPIHILHTPIHTPSTPYLFTPMHFPPHTHPIHTPSPCPFSPIHTPPPPRHGGFAALAVDAPLEAEGGGRPNGRWRQKTGSRDTEQNNARPGPQFRMNSQGQHTPTLAHGTRRGR